MNELVLPSCYAAPIAWYALYQQADKVLIETKENFVKQSYRNRCEIYSPNGVQSLVAPITLRGKRQLITDKCLSYNDDWRKIHWKSLQAAYRTSPYFEYYEDDFAPIYEKRYDRLIDLNNAVHQTIVEALDIDTEVSETSEYKKEHPLDYRNISPKTDWDKDLKFEPYIQVFNSKHGFIPRLSILDLLFNLGPASEAYLNNIQF
jgi:hypothetical protein